MAGREIKYDRSSGRALLFLIFLYFFVNGSYAQLPSLRNEQLVREFYLLNHQPLFWYASDEKRGKAIEWLTMIASSDHFGIVLDQYQSDMVRVALLNHHYPENYFTEQNDRQITGLVLNFLRNLYEGNLSFKYDAVSVPRDSFYLSTLLNMDITESVSQIVERIECHDPDYQLLKNYLNDSIAASDTVKLRKIVMAMDGLRFIAVNHTSDYIVANIPAAEVRYFKDDRLTIKMKAVVGKKGSPTPTIASYITNVVTFPHWDVPHSIAVKEILPKVQKDKNYLDKNRYDVVDGKGSIINESELKWNQYNKNSFPYFFRQASGSDNSLGILKFNLKSPYSIYLHSTNLQTAFAKEYRFLSHGCIRVEKPFDLAQALLPDKIDIKELKGKRSGETKILPLTSKLPVFIIYMPVTVTEGKVVFWPDVYGLIK